ncbi:hypothetical protein [Gillisia sp. CAL575]|uniref:hypothetical protein n=1 Tax=Gillisia sp. CAL575 TaxID=985255 RepID=UPI00054F61B2|nr:hypothetical protein [Gillisia sp. CAL575]
MSNSYRERTLNNLAIEKLKRLGFTNVDVHTLLEDEVYRSYYVKMLKNILSRKNCWETTIKSILKKARKLEE